MMGNIVPADVTNYISTKYMHFYIGLQIHVGETLCNYH
jgi:hypothetical protein